MLTNSKVRALVDRIGTDEQLKESLEQDFDGTLAREGVALSRRDRDTLQAALGFIRQFSSRQQGATVLAGWGIGC